MLVDLTGKTALVTGGGQGIGRGIALQLAANGADVAIADLNSEGASLVATEVTTLGRKGLPIDMDVTDKNSVEKAVADSINHFGQIDILANNAGIGRVQGKTGSNFTDDWEENWNTVLDINVQGIMRCSKALLPHFIERKYGKIVNTASGAGRGPIWWGPAKGPEGMASPYGPSKAAVINYTQNLASSVAAHNINVNAICPGQVWTEFHGMNPNNASQKDYDNFVQKSKEVIPLGRAQTVEEIGKLVAFLSSDDASSITGQSIHIDGGQRMV